MTDSNDDGKKGRPRGRPGRGPTSGRPTGNKPFRKPQGGARGPSAPSPVTTTAPQPRRPATGLSAPAPRTSGREPRARAATSLRQPGSRRQTLGTARRRRAVRAPARRQAFRDALGRRPALPPRGESSRVTEAGDRPFRARGPRATSHSVRAARIATARRAGAAAMPVRAAVEAKRHGAPAFRAARPCSTRRRRSPSRTGSPRSSPAPASRPAATSRR